MSIADLFELAQTLVTIRHADQDVCALLDQFEAGELTFEALMADLRSLSVVH